MGSPDLTWSDLWAIVDNLSFDDPLSRAINGKDWWWYHPAIDYIVGIYDSMLALLSIVDRRQNVKRSDIPKPTLRPWDKTKDTEVLKVKPSKLADMAKRLGWTKTK